MLFGCPTANFWGLSRGQPPLPDINHYILKLFDLKVTAKPCNEVWSLNRAERLVGVYRDASNSIATP